MNTLDLISIIHETPLIRDVFIGIYPSDILGCIYDRSKLNKVSFAIINQDPSYLKGSHWILLYITDKDVLYFCPQAQYPKQEMLQFLLESHKKVYINRKKVQHDFSTICGLYCISYVVLKMLGKCNECAIRSFKNLLRNDTFVVHLCQRFSQSTIMKCVTTRDINLGQDIDPDKREKCEIAVWTR